MKTIKLLHPLEILLTLASVGAASAQTPPGLGLQFSGGYAVLSLTGEVGTVYSIQYASGLSATNQWTDRTLLQVQGTNDVWADPSAPTPGQRFYRAVSVTAPADANLVFIQPGRFIMGSPTNEVDRLDDEGPQTTVTVSRGFWMEKYLVTQGDYLSLEGSNPSAFTPAHGYSQDLTRPVEQVTWFDASNYCALRTQQERAAGLILPNYLYRLPTEAEWEYACRAGTTTRFYYGDDGGYTDLANYAWYFDNSGHTTQPVGQLLPNPWGLYDVAGNVWEWCQDWYAPAYPGGRVTDPPGPGSSPASARVFRGGFWNNQAGECRSAQRFYFSPSGKSGGIGFRIILASGQP